MKLQVHPRTFALVPPLLAATLALRHGPALIDDAYITFRFSAQLAAGHGLVYNPGEWVLGTSSPLMAGLCALFALAGVPIPVGAVVMGIVGVAALVYAVGVLAREHLDPWGALAVATAVALHPDLTYVANSGMETALSMAAVFGAVALAFRGRSALAGAAAGAAALLRPDGAVIVALLFAWTAWRARPKLLRFCVTAAAVVTPWLVASTVLYGSPTPHSVLAKRLIHAELPGRILEAAAHRLLGSPVLAVIGALAAVGVVALVRARSSLLLVPLWFTAQVAGLAASGITAFFPWYFSPLYPVLVLLAGVGLAFLASAVRLPRASPTLVHSVLALSMGAVLLTTTRNFRQRFYDFQMVARADIYLQVGEMLRERCRPGDRVFLGEVGAVGWAMPDQVIVDSSGINSAAVLAARRADRDALVAAGRATGDLRDGSIAWVHRIIEDTQPQAIVSFAPWMHMAELAQEPAFLARYQRTPVADLDELYVFERRP